MSLAGFMLCAVSPFAGTAVLLLFLWQPWLTCAYARKEYRKAMARVSTMPPRQRTIANQHLVLALAEITHVERGVYTSTSQQKAVLRRIYRMLRAATS